LDELGELAHAYAVTIHRSQGGEYRPWSSRWPPARGWCCSATSATPRSQGLQAGRPGRFPPRAGRSRAHPRRRPPPHRAHPLPEPRRV